MIIFTLFSTTVEYQNLCAVIILTTGYPHNLASARHCILWPHNFFYLPHSIIDLDSGHFFKHGRNASELESLWNLWTPHRGNTRQSWQQGWDTIPVQSSPAWARINDWPQNRFKFVKLRVSLAKTWHTMRSRTVSVRSRRTPLPWKRKPTHDPLRPAHLRSRVEKMRSHRPPQKMVWRIQCFSISESIPTLMCRERCQNGPSGQESEGGYKAECEDHGEEWACQVFHQKGRSIYRWWNSSHRHQRYAVPWSRH